MSTKKLYSGEHYSDACPCTTCNHIRMMVAKDYKKNPTYTGDELFIHVVGALTFGIAIGMFIGWWYL